MQELLRERDELHAEVEEAHAAREEAERKAHEATSRGGLGAAAGAAAGGDGDLAKVTAKYNKLREKFQVWKGRKGVKRCGKAAVRTARG